MSVRIAHIENTPPASIPGSYYNITFYYRETNFTEIGLPDLPAISLPKSLTHAAPKRRAEFLVGRACAALGLQALGLPPIPPNIGPSGEPQWPQGITGSISHKAGSAAAWVMPILNRRTIGLDIEGWIGAEESSRFTTLILTTNEQEMVEACGNASHWVTRLFSAKEAVYKALYPHIQTFVDFTEIEALAIEEDCIAFFPVTDALKETLRGASIVCRQRWNTSGVTSFATYLPG